MIRSLGLRWRRRGRIIHDSAPLCRPSMSTHGLQRLSVRACFQVRRLLARVWTWIEARPRLARWIYPSSSADADYRVYNGRMFASFHEQERMLADARRMA